MNNAQYRSYILHNVSIDFCSAMSGKWDPTLYCFEKELKKYSNFYQPCPRRGHIYLMEHAVDIQKH